MSEAVAVAAPAAPAAPASPAPVVPAEGALPAAQDTAEQATAAKPEGEKPDTDESTEKRNSRRFERRIDKLHRRAAEASARAEFFEKQFNEFKAKTVTPSEDAGAPRLENFKDIEEYAAAKAKHESDKAVKALETNQRTEAQKRAQAKLNEDWEAKTVRGSEEFDDFEEVVGEIKPTSPWSHAVMSVENGERVAYHLGKNLKEAQEIAGLPPVMQILRIGLLSAKLAAEPAKPKTPSKAPAPITPLKGDAPVVTAVPSEGDDMKSWMSKRQKQVHGSPRR